MLLQRQELLFCITPTEPQIDVADGGRENRLHACRVSVLTGFALPTSIETCHASDRMVSNRTGNCSLDCNFEVVFMLDESVEVRF